MTVQQEWLTPTVRRLALSACAAGSDSGVVMPILADAMEDAGCTDADILDHLRGPGPHVRGCWVLDLLLGEGHALIVSDDQDASVVFAGSL
jgi:hypothetical protein